MEQTIKDEKNLSSIAIKLIDDNVLTMNALYSVDDKSNELIARLSSAYINGVIDMKNAIIKACEEEDNNEDH